MSFVPSVRNVSLKGTGIVLKFIEFLKSYETNSAVQNLGLTTNIVSTIQLEIELRYLMYCISMSDLN